MIDLEQQHREAMGEARTEAQVGPAHRRTDLGEATTEAQVGPAPRRADPGPAMAVPGHPRPRVMPPGPNDLQDPGELMPTLPRQLPSLPPAMPGPPRPMPGPLPMMSGPPPMMPGQPQTMLGPHIQVPTRRGSQVKKRTFFRPWMVFVAIVLAAAAAGVVVAMSGPHVAVQHGK